jgi:hypothetical protein
VLADDVGWVLAGGGRPVLDDPVLIGDLRRQGLWADDGVVRMLRHGQIGLVLTLYDAVRGKDCIYTLEICGAIRSHYCLAETLGNLRVYQPKERGCSAARSPGEAMGAPPA